MATKSKKRVTMSSDVFWAAETAAAWRGERRGDYIERILWRAAQRDIDAGLRRFRKEHEARPDPAAPAT
jgi:hypothetical protein